MKTRHKQVMNECASFIGVTVLMASASLFAMAALAGATQTGVASMIGIAVGLLIMGRVD